MVKDVAKENVVCGVRVKESTCKTLKNAVWTMNVREHTLDLYAPCDALPSLMVKVRAVRRPLSVLKPLYIHRNLPLKPVRLLASLDQEQTWTKHTLPCLLT